MDATTLYLGNGLSRTVRGRAEDIGAVLRPRQLGADNGMRTFTTIDGDTITVAVGAVALAEAAKTTTKTGGFGFSRALELGRESGY
jgi:hypothetical protein